MHWCKRIVQLDESFVNLFYKRTQLDPRIEITKQDFITAYKKTHQLSLFSLIPDVIDGFRDSYLNIDNEESPLYGCASDMGLSEIQMDSLK